MMKREERYVVMKHTDIDSALSDSDKLLLSAVLNKVERYRKENGKEPIKAVVVENDWPEYEDVWKKLEARVEREEKIRKFKEMFSDKEHMGFFYAVESHNDGLFLITSNAHSSSRLRNYGGYKFRALFSNDCTFDPNETMITGWGVHFKTVVQLELDEILALYDPNRSISNYNVAEYVRDKLKMF